MIKYAAFNPDKKTSSMKSGSSRPTFTSLLKRHGRWLPPLSAFLALAAWEWVVKVSKLPAFILPTPGQVFNKFIQTLADGSLLEHSLVTLSEVLLGLLVGSLLATFTGYWLARSRLLERTLSPYLVASQAVPVVAIAPLL